MSWDVKLREALLPLGLPVARNMYDGDEKIYLVFNASVIPDDFSDDEPGHERALIQVHLFALPTVNTIAKRGEIKAALQAAGFLYPAETDVSDEGDEGEQHVVFETQYADSIHNA